MGDHNFFNFTELGEAMRPESLRGEAFRLSRGERDYVADHALDSICKLAEDLARSLGAKRATTLGDLPEPSDAARKIAALSNLLGDIAWKREGERPSTHFSQHGWNLGEFFPVAQLRPWLEEWVKGDADALRVAEGLLATSQLAVDSQVRDCQSKAVADAQTKLGTGGLLLARLKKWMASRGN